jgi:hypothetical protein
MGKEEKRHGGDDVHISSVAVVECVVLLCEEGVDL